MAQEFHQYLVKFFWPKHLNPDLHPQTHDQGIVKTASGWFDGLYVWPDMQPWGHGIVVEEFGRWGINSRVPEWVGSGDCRQSEALFCYQVISGTDSAPIFSRGEFSVRPTAVLRAT